MSKASYIFRFDDITPNMNWARFSALKHLFQQYQVPAILGVVPDNQDPALNVTSPNPVFWQEIRALHQAGWVIAQHGYHHTYHTSEGGILNIQRRSEFAGRSYETQRADILAGKQRLEADLTFPIHWWMAPAHSLDATTCRVLTELGFTHITDGVSLFPYRDYGLTWVPAQLWQPRSLPWGVWTICIHLNTLSDAGFKEIEDFLTTHASQCTVTPPAARPRLLSYPFIAAWRSALGVKQWREHKQQKATESFHYTNPVAYDTRARDPIEKYIHTLWQPLLRSLIVAHVRPDTVVCDLGCGTLEHTQFMGEAKHVYAIDSNRTMIQHGLPKIRRFADKVSLREEDALHTSLPTATCDIIWSVGLSEFVNLPDLFHELDRIAKPNGRLFIQFPNKLHPYNATVVLAARMLGIRIKQYRTLSEWKKIAEGYSWYIETTISRGIFFYTPHFLHRPLLTLWRLIDHLYRPFQSAFPLGNNIFVILKRESDRKNPPA